MKNSLLVIIAFLLSFTAFAQEDLKAKVKELEKRLEDVEYSNMGKKSFYIGGNLINHYENYHEAAKISGANDDHNTLNVFATVFALDLNFDVSSRLKIYSRTGMSKFWNTANSSNHDNAQQYSRNNAADSWDTSMLGSYGFTGSGLFLDRAYFSYAVTDTIMIAAGRMPTNQGSPSNQLDALERQGTYPRFAYNAIYDGAAISYDFKNFLPKNHSLRARAFYTPFINVSETKKTQDREENGLKAKALTPQYTVQIDYETQAFKGFANNILLTYFYYYYDNFFQWTPDNSLETNGTLYDYKALVHMGYLGFEGLFGTGLNISWSHLYAEGKNTVMDGTDENTAFSSNANLVNVNYKTTKNVVIGTEYIKTDDGFYLDEWTYVTLSDFYKAPNNEGFHYFVSFPVWENTRMRIGYFDYKKKESKLWMDEDNRNVKSLYSQLRVNF